MRFFSTLTVVVSLAVPTLAYAGGDPDDIDLSLKPDTSDVQPVVASENYSLLTEETDAGLRSMQLYASDKTAELTYRRMGPAFNMNNSRTSIGFLFNEGRDNVITGAIMYDAQPEFFPGLSLSFGAKGYAGLLGMENADVVGLAAAIEAAYALPIRQLPLVFSAEISYAPDIFTFGQSDRIIDWNVRSSLKLTDNIEGFVGLRFLQFDTRPGDRELDKRVHLGIRWSLGS